MNTFSNHFMYTEQFEFYEISGYSLTFQEYKKDACVSFIFKAILMVKSTRPYYFLFEIDDTFQVLPVSTRF